ncbi:hypothetical protein BDV19DRAFT_229043 [Aspergillus venezuelensis]
MSYRAMASKRGGAWARVVIFVSLYVLLLESIFEWVVVLYLYGNKHVDSKMVPSLIFALVASFLTVPQVVLHSFLALQYNKVLEYANQKVVLHNVCTYLLRITTLAWLGASVSGLVVVSQQAFCLPVASGGSYWQVGVSCALHRAVVIVSVISFITICLYFCSRELCERPYDVWLLGVYHHKRRSQDGSILSASTLNSDKSSKRDLLCVCRHSDLTYGQVPYIKTRNSEKYGTVPGLQVPAQVRPTSFLDVSPVSDAEAECLSKTTVASGPRSDVFSSSVFRTPSTLTTQSSLPAQNEALPELPSANFQRASKHTRNKSSGSSLRRFLPRSLPASLPLSSDPQIRALAEANARVNLEKQEPKEEEHESEESKPPAPPTVSPPPPPKGEKSCINSQTTERTTTSLPKSSSMSSADAPEVVTPAPLNIHRSNTAHTAPISPTDNLTLTPWDTLLRPNRPHPLRMNTMHIPQWPGQSSGQFEQAYTQMPHYIQNQRFPGTVNRNRNSRHLRRNETEIIRHYQKPGARRPRSPTFGNISIASVPGHLDCIRETGASIDELPGSEVRPPSKSR